MNTRKKGYSVYSRARNPYFRVWLRGRRAATLRPLFCLNFVRFSCCFQSFPSHNSGYTNGYNSGHSNFSRGGVCSAVWWRDLTFTIGNGSNNSGFTANDSATLPAGTYAYACGVRTTNWAGSASISVNGSVIANKNTDAGDKYEYSGGGFYTLNSPATVSTSASVYNGCAFAMFVRIS